MSDKKSVFVDNLTVLASPEGIQKYVLGSKKNGKPRALYDVLKDIFMDDDKKKKKKHKNKDKKHKKSKYEFYIATKKKGKKKKREHWHI